MEPQFFVATSTQVAALRTEVLRPNRSPDNPLRYDEDDFATTIHVLMKTNDSIFAVATFMQHPSPVDEKLGFRLRGMAVSPDHQGLGIGTKLLENALQVLLDRFPNIETVWCNARVSAVSFYEKSGFEKSGPEFEIDGVGPHFVMWRTL